jgi:hypothetical protein
VAVISGLRRALSASLRVSGAEVSSAELLFVQPEGDLRTFLSLSYVDGEAVETAFRNAGVTIIVRATTGDVTAVGFTTDGQGKPCLSIVRSEGSVVELRLSIPHSITH